MNEQNNQNNQNQTEEVEVVELENSQNIQEETTIDIEEVLGQAEWKMPEEAAAPKKSYIKKALLPLIMAIILALLGIAHIGVNVYDSHKEYSKVNIGYDKYFEKTFREQVEQMEKQYGQSFEQMAGISIEEYLDNYRKDYPEQYEKDKEYYLENVLEPAKETYVDEISSAIMMGVFVIALAEVLRNIAMIKIRKAKEEDEKCDCDCGCDCGCECNCQ